MLKFSQPTSADHESLIIWLEFLVTTRQSFGLETVLDFTGQAHTDSFTSTPHPHLGNQKDTVERMRDCKSMREVPMQ